MRIENQACQLPRYSIKDLFVATTLIALAFGLIYNFGFSGPRPLPFAVTFAVWLSIGPLIGAGLFAPFKRLWMGAAVGLVIQWLRLFTWYYLLDWL